MRSVLIVSLLALAACSTTVKDTEPSAPPEPSDRSATQDPIDPNAPTPRTLPTTRTQSSTNQGPENVKDFLPFIDVAMDPGASNSNDTNAISLVNYYTRLRIKTLTPKATDMSGTASGAYLEGDADRSYRSESRSWLSRMFSSKSVSRTLLAEFDLSKPDIKATEALFAASFTSSRQEGETWSTDQSLAVYATPWFKVSSNTTLTAKMRMQLADTRESTGASASFIGTLSNAATLMAPTASLVTYFSAPAVTQSSNFLDSAVSSLFGRAITEQSTGTMPLKTWQPNRPLLVVSAAMPDARDIRKTNDREILGAWEVYLEPPILSMFTTEVLSFGDEVYPDYISVSSADVLGFKIGDELTVYDYVFSRLEIADRIDELNMTGEPELARKICNRIDRGLSEIGFNSWDSAKGVWAVAKSDRLTMMASDALMNPENCAVLERLD
ncbi:MAG: hypothetical protein Hens3KO_14610 [Henriciella sp.]